MPRVSERYLKERKIKITKAATLVFAKKGYSDTTMQDIMLEAEISRGGLYAHFANIDSVFIAVLQNEDLLPHNQFLTPNYEKPLLQQLKDWLCKIETTIQTTDKGLIRAKSEFFLSHSITEVPYLRERHEKLSFDIQHFINIGIERGEFKKQVDAVAFSELLIAVLNGVMLHQYYQYSRYINCDNIFNLLLDMIENTIPKGGLHNV
jgi:AcrR family transcriptional regulator